MSTDPASVILAALGLIREAAKAIEDIQKLTADGPRDLSADEMAVLKGKVDASYSKFQQVLADRGID